MSFFCRSSDNKRAVWKLGDLSEHSEGGGHGTLRAKFDLSDGPSNPRAVAVQFVSEGITMSGVDFELAGPGYRVPLVKKRLVTGMSGLHLLHFVHHETLNMLLKTAAQCLQSNCILYRVRTNSEGIFCAFIHLSGFRPLLE